MEKNLEKQGSMCIGFVDLEMALDTVSREIALAGSARSRGQDG